jgi:transposase InsO family protein
MKGESSVAQLCAALGVSRSGYYAWAKAGPSARAQADAVLAEQIAALHARHRGRYGAPRLQRALGQRGPAPSRKRVARLMRQKGLRGNRPPRFVPRTTDSRHDYPVAPNRLAQRPAPTGPNQVWVSDLTYVRTAEGWLYLAVILDLWSRRVIGWAGGTTLTTATVLAALHMALRHRRPPRGLLHHSDRGVQYASAEHRAVLAAAGLEPSMSRTANPYDNAVMESFMATYKRECVGLAQAADGYASRTQATTDFFAYAETYYNRERLHSALGYQSPVDFENQLN